MSSNSQAFKFLVGVGGIYGTYMYYGIIQEKLFKTDYPTVDGKGANKFRFSFMLLFTQCLFSVIVAFTMNLKNTKRTQISFKEKFIIGFFNFVSMIGSNTALGFMSYPLQALFKSCKVLSVLIVGLLFGKTNYPKSQYICGLVVTAGIILFNLCEDMKSGKETQLIGIVMILLSLFCDGMLAEKQTELRKKSNPSSFELMEVCSFWCVVLSLIYSIVTGQLFTCINFISTHNHIMFDILVIGFLGCVGQVFIFYTISNFGPVVLALVTTTRKFFTVLASIFMYGHKLYLGQWGGVFLVLLGVSYELYESYKKNTQHKPKVEEEENKKLVKENGNGKHQETHESNASLRGKKQQQSS